MDSWFIPIKKCHKTAVIVQSALLVSACDLTVTVSGNGAGSVYSDVSGIQCGNTETNCKASFNQNTTVTLTAQEKPNAAFVRWEGACNGDTPTCVLSMNQPRDVTAYFTSLIPTDPACGTEGAKAACGIPQQTDDYYVEQSIKYFLTMDSSVNISVQPNYSLMVARWEWHPWLLLTGLGNANLIMTDILLKLHPTAYDSIDCRAFPTQPYGRCHVVFNYSGEPCPIYEEFTFNEQGEMTFIEAWSDYPSLVPMADPEDYWAEGEHVSRLSTRVPGLGTSDGLITINSAEMALSASEDADLADFRRRAQKPYTEYFRELATHSQQVASGCKPPL